VSYFVRPAYYSQPDSARNDHHRATYVGAGRGEVLPPDPGAMAVYFGVKGILDALRSDM
jgi:hypothetical protein